jgi:hypothetical protein
MAFSSVILSVVMLSVTNKPIELSFIMLTVVMLNVIMPGVVAPSCHLFKMTATVKCPGHIIFGKVDPRPRHRTKRVWQDCTLSTIYYFSIS